MRLSQQFVQGGGRADCLALPCLLACPTYVAGLPAPTTIQRALLHCTPPASPYRHAAAPALPLPPPPQAGGLHPNCIQRALLHTNPPPVLIDMLLVVSQLARISKDSFNTYEPISKAAIYPHVRK